MSTDAFNIEFEVGFGRPRAARATRATDEQPSRHRQRPPAARDPCRVVFASRPDLSRLLRVAAGPVLGGIIVPATSREPRSAPAACRAGVALARPSRSPAASRSHDPRRSETARRAPRVMGGDGRSPFPPPASPTCARLTRRSLPGSSSLRAARAVCVVSFSCVWSRVQLDCRVRRRVHGDRELPALSLPEPIRRERRSLPGLPIERAGGATMVPSQRNSLLRGCSPPEGRLSLIVAARLSPVARVYIPNARVPVIAAPVWRRWNIARSH